MSFDAQHVRKYPHQPQFTDKRVSCRAMNSARASATAVVIGGGVIGLFTALRLREAGFAVRLLERGEVGRSASWAGGGILCPLYPWRAPPEVWALAAESMASYSGICDSLADATGIDPEWTPSGMRIFDAFDATELATIRDWATASGLLVIASESALSGAPRPSHWLPWVAQLRNPRLCRALAARLRQLGVQISEGVADISLAVRGNIAYVANPKIEADVVVACAGAWTNALLTPLNWPQAIAPVRGQMLLFRAKPGLLREIVLNKDRYLIPRRDGYILAGSTVEPEAGFDASITAAALDELRSFATELMPELSSARIEHQWAGLRPGSRNGVPVISRHPELSNLFINAGHYRNGLTMAPASALSLCRLIQPAY